jgi:hypothetical protein
LDQDISLPAYKASHQNGSKKRYGSNGNSLFAQLNLGQKCQITLLDSGTQSKHFYDQAEMYKKVNSKTFYFTKKIY